ncbi:CubicO group peptidase, beta-lactamase class C family [Mucilaginibacter pineti]|uniref:CubicO group peptidase, beta-lactamase class C family n=1 Tax=Mucilaginibacter pineti TaxID=1391627 RepID=A0A1G7B1G2_9SPHI|nr:serine hydrolase [Mucilaginibacter pineti]SDE20772.1 CubicO group peptidase, beta-lactamase class C family [Mucilaginibacter pineti]
MKKSVLILLAHLFAITVALGQQPAFIEKDLDTYIKQGLKEWNIPGLAIAIVKDGKTIVMKGYGVRDLKTQEPVDENTLFMIASNSKLFTGTALAQLDVEHKLSLDDKITKYFPDYSVYDANTTALLTIKDLLGHHLGTGTFQGDFTFWNTALTRQQIMDKMKLLKPMAGFRQTYGYCNSCFLTAGQVIPVVTGKPWETYIQDVFLTPLGMDNTYPLSTGIAARKNVAKPYSNTFTGKLIELPYDQVDNLAPAGSIVSCVKDVAKWLTMQLDSGKYNGKQIVAWQALQKTRDENTIINSRRQKAFPMHFRGYGLGVVMADYNGKQVFWHTGGANGFVTNTCFVPEEKLAITILTNNDNQSFFEALRYQILDAYLGVPYVNRSEAALKGFPEEVAASAKKTADMQVRVKNTQPELPLSAYAGRYQNTVYGPIDIVVNKKELQIKLNGHRDITARVQYMDNGEWLMTYSNPAFGIFPIKFKTENSKVVSTEVKVNDFIEFDPYLFVKEN